jgi:hypothetical protein
MAKGTVFSFNDLIPKLEKNYVTTSKASLKGLLELKSKGVPQEEVLAILQGGINRASQRITVDLKAALDAALRSSIWPTPSGSADIYETGKLLESGTVSFDKEGIKISYSAPYAALVHYGGYINPYGNSNSKVYLPPRPWVDSVLNGNGAVKQFDFTKYYLEEISAAFRG